MKINCEYERDEICVNDACPYCADYCPVWEHPEICAYNELRRTDYAAPDR